MYHINIVNEFISKTLFSESYMIHVARIALRLRCLWRLLDCRRNSIPRMMYHRSWVGSREIRLRVRTSSCGHLAKFHASDCRTVSRDRDRYKEEREREREREGGGKREGREKRMLLASIYRCDYLAPLTSAGYRRAVGRSTRMARYPMNGARNLVSGSLNVAGGASEVNSWSTSESLLHSRQCELPFEISIFYAYTWETCRRTHAGAHDYPIPPRSEEVYLRTYGECTQPRCIRGGPEAPTLSFLPLGSISFCFSLTSSFCRALLAPTSSYYELVHPRPLYATPCLWEVASDLISTTRLLWSGSPRFKAHSCVYDRVRLVAFSKLQHFRMERMRFDTGHFPPGRYPFTWRVTG